MRPREPQHDGEVPEWVLYFDPQRWTDPSDRPPAEVEVLASPKRWREILAHRRWSEAARAWWADAGRDPRELFRAQQRAARRVALCEEHRPPADNYNV